MSAGASALHDPAEHRPLAGAPWSDAAARDAIAEIAADAVAAYRGPERLWPNHPADELRPDEDVPMHNVYFGAAGVAWAIERLAGRGLGPELPGAAELAASLPAGYRASPELAGLQTGTPPPAPSLLFGESGILLVAEALGAPDPARRDRLEACLVANSRNVARELCWGSPGTLHAAHAMWTATGEPRWAAAWRDGAAWLLEQWHETVWVQELYGEVRRYVGAGHGFAGVAGSLLAGADLLDDATAEVLRARVASTAAGLAVRDGALAQWPGLADAEIPRRPVQWCHGAPGVVTSLAELPASAASDALLLAGGELTWRAGPLTKGPGLCHGTAGNGYALLALWTRTGHERWLTRAREFAMDAAAHVRRERVRRGRGRYALFTGDVGAALLLSACLGAERPAPFPFLSDALDRPARAGRRASA